MLYPLFLETTESPALLVVVPFALAVTAFLSVFTKANASFDQRIVVAKGYVELVERFESLWDSLEERSRTEPPVPALQASVRILNEVLRIPIEARLANPAAAPMSEDVTTRFLLGVLQYCAQLIDDGDEPSIRCGLVIPHPSSDSVYVPIVTYSPGQNEYRSPHRFDDSDFPAVLLRRFEHYKDTHELQSHIVDCEGDLQGYVEDAPDDPPKFRYKDETQREYMRSLLGTVIYVRDGRNRKRSLGVLCFDAPAPHALSLERYNLVLPFLRLAYRVIALRLLAIEAHPEQFASLIVPGGNHA